MSAAERVQPPMPLRSGTRVLGRRALVTGFGNGIGRASALLLAAQGAQVMGIDIDAGAAADSVAQGRELGVVLHSHAPCDLTQQDQVADAVAHAAAELGGIDILVNAAAFAHFAWLPEMDFASQWRRTLAGELDTVFLACQAAWPHLARQGGAIVNFASANARMALPLSGAVAHCAGKGGVLAMSRQLAMEGAPLGVRVNTVSPALIETAATRAHLQQVRGLRAQVMEKLMLKRVGQPEDVAWCVLYLTSDEAAWVTGADICVDAGATSW